MLFLYFLLLGSAVLGCKDTQKYIVAFERGDVFSRATNHSITRNWEFGDFRGASVEFSTETACVAFFRDRALRKRSSMGFVAEQDDILQIQDIQRNPTWGLDRIDQASLPLDGSFQFPSSAGKDTNIYIVDTGIKLEHLEFEGRAEWGTTIVSSTTDTDNHGHGTHVAGIAGGFRYGVAKKAKLIAVKALGDDGRGSFGDVIQGLQYIADRVSSGTDPAKHHVINISVQGRTNRVFDRAVAAMAQLGIHVIVASGNNGEKSCGISPASASSASSVVSVGAVDQMDRVPPFSNYGSCTSILAPVLTAGDLAGSKLLSGTSMASPFVAGTIAILVSSGTTPTTPAAVKELLVSNARFEAHTVDGYTVDYAGILQMPNLSRSLK